MDKIQAIEKSLYNWLNYCDIPPTKLHINTIDFIDIKSKVKDGVTIFGLECVVLDKIEKGKFYIS